MPPVSEKLRKERADKTPVSPSVATAEPSVPIQDTIIKVRPIRCCNDFVAILQFDREAGIDLPDTYKQKNEGLVVGIGPGVPVDGARVPSQLEIGDVVMFQEKSIITTVESSSEPYAGKRIVILSERNIICVLPIEVEFEVTDA